MKPAAPIMPTLLALLGLLPTSTVGHMFLSSPPALKSSVNPNTIDPDSSLTSPISGSQYPCKGYQSLLSTPEGAPVASWTAGTTVSMSAGGSAIHGGGSCQVALSYDSGGTFTVVHTWQGNCPAAPDAEMAFRLPGDAPSGEDVLFAWAWWNRVGNREMYMNCAVVTIDGEKGTEAVAWEQRPELWKANLGDGCFTVEGKPVRIPEPGPDVSVDESTGELGEPVGCAAGSGPGSGSGSGSGSGTGNVADGMPSSIASQTPGSATNFPSSNGGAGKGQDGTVTFGQGQSYTPGNDWPEGWENGAAGGSSSEAFVSLAFAGMFAAGFVLA